MTEYVIHQVQPHARQAEIKASQAKRKIIKAGRRGGKTVTAADIAVDKFLDGHRVLYAAPTADQLGRFWTTVTRALREPIDAGVLHKDKTLHIIERTGTENRIRAKTAWNADTLRGDYADYLILDEWQLMDEEAWEVVGAPMLLDNDGDALFIYTPPSLRSRSVSKARDPRHAAKMFERARQDTTGRWEAFSFTSHDNPHISAAALREITGDMSSLAYRMEIMAEDVDEAPGALWTRDIIEQSRVVKAPALDVIVVGLDPSATSGGDDAGIVANGVHAGHYYVIEDATIQGSPKTWAEAAVTLYHKLKANYIAAEANNGGEMVALTIATVDPDVPVKLVHASRGKQTRAEPISALYERGIFHHVGSFPGLEDEMCLWIPGDKSPNRMDAHVWAATLLKDTPSARAEDYQDMGQEQVTPKWG